MPNSVAALSTNEICSRFVRRVKDLQESELIKIGAWSVVFNGNPAECNGPTRAQLIDYLALFRQFFLHQKPEPVSVKTVIARLRQTIPDQDLLDAIAQIEACDPFALEFHLETHGRRFDLRQLTEAFISKYFHSDRIPAELANDGYSWQTQVFPLALVFERGSKVIVALRAVILEAERRGLLSLAERMDRTGLSFFE